MTISFEQMQLLLHQQQQQFEACQLSLIEKLTKQFSIQNLGSSNSEKTESIGSSIVEFNFEPSTGVTFEAWFRRYEDLFRVECAHLDDSAKVRLLLRKLGPAEHNKYVNHILPKNSRELNFEETVQTLTNIFGEQLSLFSIRYNCFKISKDPGDDILTYAGKVNRECERSKIRSLTDDQFKCLIFVCGLKSSVDSDIRTRILAEIERKPDMTLQEVTAECQRIINLKHDTKLIEDGQVHEFTSVQAVKSNNSLQVKHKPPTNCWFCGSWHFGKFCPYKRHKCSICNKYGHKEGFCPPVKPRSIRSHNTMAQSRKFRSRSTKPQISSMFATFKVDFESKRKFVTLSINQKPVRLQLDTASDITIISPQTWRALGCPPYQRTEHTARNASGDVMKLSGQIECDVTFRSTSFKGTCYITNRHDLNLLGIDWIEKMKLWDVPLNSVCSNVQCSDSPTNMLMHPNSTSKFISHLRTKHAAVFQESLGCCIVQKARLYLKPDAKPVFRPKRPVPYAALSSLDAELDRLEKLNVIKPVDYSSWAAPIVVVKKANGTIRLCADFSTGLNNALEDQPYPLPVPQDLFVKLNGGKYFSKLDLAEAYLQIEVEDDSKELLTINTHKGLYQFQRLPYGVKPAPAIFQQIMDAILAGVSGVAVYLDDIIVTGETQFELFNRLDKVLTILSDSGFHLRPDKCNFFMTSVKYLGFIFDKDGRKPDPSSVSAIQQMPAPNNLSTLQSFLGMTS